jgi:NADP-dependent 3-hydroxy acid dehydrogenase YdfG
LAQRFPARRAFITGAASGFGLACAELLAREGWSLMLTDVDAARLSIVSAGFAAQGVRVASEACDVRDSAALANIVAAAAHVLGGIDLAVNSAGVAAIGPFVDSDPGDWQWMFDINVHGVANACRALLPQMLRNRNGLIINVASAAAFCTGANMSGYNAAKAAVVALSESLQQEYGAQGLQIVAAMPGFFRTRLMEDARGPDRVLAAAQRLMEDSRLNADHVAEQVLTSAGAGSTHIVYPPYYRWLWRWKRLTPQLFQRWFPRVGGRSRKSSRDLH